MFRSGIRIQSGLKCLASGKRLHHHALADALSRPLVAMSLDDPRRDHHQRRHRPRDSHVVEESGSQGVEPSQRVEPSQHHMRVVEESGSQGSAWPSKNARARQHGARQKSTRALQIKPMPSIRSFIPDLCQVVVGAHI